MTNCYVDNFRAQITIPMVVAFCASGGADYDPVQYIIATSADGERVGALEFSWHWPDNPCPHPLSSGSSPNTFPCEWNPRGYTPLACLTPCTPQRVNTFFRCRCSN